MHLIKFTLITLSPMLLGACATNALFNNTATETSTKTQIALQDQIIAIGHASKPIQGFEHALVLAGNQHSFLVQPNQDQNNPRDLFQQIFSQIDLNAVYIAPAMLDETISHLNKQQYNSIILKLDEKLKNSQSVPYKASLYFLKPTQKVSAKEQVQLTSLGFKCQTKLQDYPQQTFCSRDINTEITLASKVQNLNNLQYKLKQPINIQYQVTTTSNNYSKHLFKVFTPVTVAFDIVTSPIQGGVYLLAAMLGAPGSL